MADASTPRDRWAAQIAALDATPASPRGSKAPLSVDRIVTAGLGIVKAQGYDALSMRSVAAALETGPASLYAHVRNKAELDDLLVGALCARVELPTPDATRWDEQVLDVCRLLRDQYLAHPGISRALLVSPPTSLDTLRISEGLLAILLAGGVSPQSAAWAVDALLLYVSAYSLEASLGDRQATGSEAVERLAMLPTDRFPNTIAHARELNTGTGHERFDFTIDLVLRGLDPQISSRVDS